MIPATKIPHANAIAVVSGKSDETSIAAEIMDKFKNTGVNAGAANRPTLFSTDPLNAVREINNIYGKVILRRSEANSNSFDSPRNPGPNIETRTGEPITPITAMTSKIKPSVPEVSAISFLTSTLVRLV